VLTDRRDTRTEYRQSIQVLSRGEEATVGNDDDGGDNATAESMAVVIWSHGGMEPGLADRDGPGRRRPTPRRQMLSTAADRRRYAASSIGRADNI